MWGSGVCGPAGSHTSLSTDWKFHWLVAVPSPITVPSKVNYTEDPGETSCVATDLLARLWPEVHSPVKTGWEYFPVQTLLNFSQIVLRKYWIGS